MNGELRGVINTYLAGRLKMVRMARGLTREQVAKRAGIARESYRKLESGARQVQVEHLVRLATGLAGSIDEIFSLPDFRRNGGKTDAQSVTRVLMQALREGSTRWVGAEDIVSAVAQAWEVPVENLRRKGVGGPNKNPPRWLEACVACATLAQEFNVAMDDLSDSMGCSPMAVYQRRFRYKAKGRESEDLPERLRKARRILVNKMAKGPRKDEDEPSIWVGVAADWKRRLAGVVTAEDREEAYRRLDRLIRRAWSDERDGEPPPDASARRDAWTRKGRVWLVEELGGGSEGWLGTDRD